MVKCDYEDFSFIIKKYVIYSLDLIGKDLNNGDRDPRNPSGTSNSPNSLPTAEQQSAPNGHAVAPAVAGRTPSNSSSTRLSCLVKFFLLLLVAHISPN